jgi:hypothetical protein
MSGVVTAHIGNNADLIYEVCRMYAPAPSSYRVLDVTWGKGAFWSRVQADPAMRSRLELVGSDLEPSLQPDPSDGRVDVWRTCDFRSLPDADASADIVVLDPPYVHSPGKHMTDGRYNNAATTKGFYHDDIMNLYREGMTEARRVLKDGGLVWVKCKDQVMSGQQRWSVVDLHRIATEELGLYAQDMFVLIPTSRTSSNRWSTQKHARKNHSFLWVFSKRTVSLSRVRRSS